MENSVRFYLAEQTYINLDANLEKVYPYRSATQNTTQVFSSSLEISGIQLVDRQQEKDHHEQLCNEIASVFQDRVLKLTLELTPRTSPTNLIGTYAAQQRIANKNTKIEIGFQGISKKGRKILAEKRKTYFLEAEMFDFGLDQLQQPYGHRTMRLPTAYQVPTVWIKTQEMQNTASKLSELRYADASYNPVIENFFNNYYKYQHTSARVNIFLIAKGIKQSPVFLQPSENQKMIIYKRILDQELATDAAILPSNGVEVKCHRSFLAAHSDVFQTMFSTDMEEARTQRIEMPDMSEKGVRAFLAYLYYWDKSQAEKSSAVAVELMKACHKYNISFLEQAMRNLLLSKPEVWYEVDAAMKLFLFVRNFDTEWEPFKKKAVMVLKKKTPDLKNSPTVKELFRDNPEAAMDFCQYAIAI